MTVKNKERTLSRMRRTRNGLKQVQVMMLVAVLVLVLVVFLLPKNKEKGAVWKV
jgi:hypothetical protein